MTRVQLGTMLHTMRQIQLCTQILVYIVYTRGLGDCGGSDGAPKAPQTAPTPDM
jgi:hypothetical protein